MSLSDFILDGHVIEIYDANGHPQEVTVREALIIQAQQATAEDQSLGIQRQQIPLSLNLLPDSPETTAFCQLAQRIGRLATFQLMPETEQQANWMRCHQLYWQAKSFALSHKIIFQHQGSSTIPNPISKKGSLRKTLPKVAIETLDAETEVETAIYHLITQGESLIRDWAKQENLDYPFNNATELFLEILREEFESALIYGPFHSHLQKPSNDKQKAHHRLWSKFFRNCFDDDPQQEECHFQILKTMDWQGYWILALWKHKDTPTYSKLWHSYTKSFTKLVNQFAPPFSWRNGIPYQSKRTSNLKAIKSEIDHNGYFNWCWDEK